MDPIIKREIEKIRTEAAETSQYFYINIMIINLIIF